MTVLRVDEPRRETKKHRSGDDGYAEGVAVGDGDDRGIMRFHGDGLVVRMNSNRCVLEIVGDGCRIVLSENSGSVHVVGDGCRVRVNRNVGDIQYTGDGGRVLLGPDSVRERVTYVGDGGKVISGPPASAPSARNSRESSCGESAEQENRRTAEEKVIGDGALPSSAACFDNAFNDAIEKRAMKITRSSARHGVITKISTEMLKEDNERAKTYLCGTSTIVIKSTNVIRPARVAGVSQANAKVE